MSPVGLILIVLLVIMLCGIPGIPIGYNRAGVYGYQPSGVLGVILLILLLLFLFGRGHVLGY